MKNLYYLIWSDAIMSIRKFNPNKKDWKIAIFVFITWIHALYVKKRYRLIYSFSIPILAFVSAILYGILT